MVEAVGSGGEEGERKRGKEGGWSTCWVPVLCRLLRIKKMGAVAPFDDMQQLVAGYRGDRGFTSTCCCCCSCCWAQPRTFCLCLSLAYVSERTSLFLMWLVCCPMVAPAAGTGGPASSPSLGRFLLLMLCFQLVCSCSGPTVNQTHQQVAAAAVSGTTRAAGARLYDLGDTRSFYSM